MENEIFKRKCAKGWGRDQSAHFFCEESGYKYFTLCSPGGKTEAAAAKSLQLCPTLCDPIDGSPPGPVPGILQARTLESVAVSFSNTYILYGVDMHKTAFYIIWQNFIPCLHFIFNLS